MPFSFGSQRSFTEASSQQQSSSRSFVDPLQQPFLDFLRNTGQGFVGQQMQQLGGLQQTTQGLLGAGQGLLGQLGGIGAPGNGFDPQSVANQQIGQLGTDLGAFFNQQLLPGIRRDAVSAGALGGGRQNVAMGVAAGELGRAFTGGVTDILANAQQQGLVNQGQRVQALLGGLGSIPGLAGVAGQPLQATFNPLLQFASLLGGPTVLNQAQATASSRSRSEGRGLEVGLDFGFGG